MPLNVFREHYPKKSDMLKFAAKELKIPGVVIKILFDRCGMWCCETTHPLRCKCGGCK
jgi:hypothetical protein